VTQFLVINVNNTWTKVAPWRGNRLGRMERVKTADLTLTTTRSWKTRFPQWPACIASVVPKYNPLFNRTFPGTRHHQISHQSPLGFKIRFPKPHTVGADRLANAAAVCADYHPPTVVLDFGTALTFDILDPSGDYLGGVIAPGLGVFTDYLSERTALLPRLTLSAPPSVIGTSTEHAMRSGAFHGYRGLVREILHGVKRELGTRHLQVIATGGHGRLLADSIPEIDIVDPQLTLKGIARIGQAWLNDLPL